MSDIRTALQKLLDILSAAANTAFNHEGYLFKSMFSKPDTNMKFSWSDCPTPLELFKKTWAYSHKVIATEITPAKKAGKVENFNQEIILTISLNEISADMLKKIVDNISKVKGTGKITLQLPLVEDDGIEFSYDFRAAILAEKDFVDNIGTLVNMSCKGLNVIPVRRDIENNTLIFAAVAPTNEIADAIVLKTGSNVTIHTISPEQFRQFKHKIPA